MSTLSEIAAKTLGDSTSYAVYTDKFDASLLNPMPRIEGRKDWGLENYQPIGFDTWHCHEASFLLDNGAPVAGTLKFIYDASSEYMVESKSMKLYLNSFDMCKMGKTLTQAIANYEDQISDDLEKIIKMPVMVKFFPSGTTSHFFDSLNWKYEDIFKYNEYAISQEVFDDYYAEKNHLKFVPMSFELPRRYNYMTNVLRSRCRHTKQKDTGSFYTGIITQGCAVDQVSLFKQVVSLREVNEFHELCAEKLLNEITSKDEVIDCVVTLMYSRRGSLDICPTRATSRMMLPDVLGNVNLLTEKVQGQ